MAISITMIISLWLFSVLSLYGCIFLNSPIYQWDNQYQFMVVFLHLDTL